MAPQQRTKQARAAGAQARRATQEPQAAHDGTREEAHEGTREEAHDGLGRERPRVRTMNSGNPRVTVAFPFSKIEIREPPDALRDLAALVDRLAEQVAEVAGTAAPAEAERARQLATDAALLARKIATA